MKQIELNGGGIFAELSFESALLPPGEKVGLVVRHGSKVLPVMLIWKAEFREYLKQLVNLTKAKKERSSLQKLGEDAPAGPHVHCGRVVPLPHEDLGRTVPKRDDL